MNAVDWAFIGAVPAMVVLAWIAEQIEYAVPTRSYSATPPAPPPMKSIKQSKGQHMELKPTNEFHISFDTKGDGGYIKAIKVTIEHDVMDAIDTVRVDLADHPLYKALQQYVLANPRP